MYETPGNIVVMTGTFQEGVAIKDNGDPYYVPPASVTPAYAVAMLREMVRTYIWHPVAITDRIKERTARLDELASLTRSAKVHEWIAREKKMSALFLSKQKARQMYSLVQVIPSFEGQIDYTKEQRTLRAISLILKSHYAVPGSLTNEDFFKGVEDDQSQTKEPEVEPEAVSEFAVETATANNGI